MKQSSYSPWKIVSNSIISAKNSLWNLVMGGYIKLSNQVDAITSDNYPIQIKSGVSDGATAVGFQLDTNTALANATSKIASIKSGGVEHFMLGAGKASFGLGNTVTQGYAFGDSNTANGAYSFVVGTGSSAVAYGIALGFGSVVTDANGSLAIGGALASGYASTAIGPDNQSRGFYALTMGGYSNYNDGYVCNLFGIQNTADAGSQFCNLLGNTNVAIGSDASLIGSSNTANTASGACLGANNTIYYTSYAIGSGNTAGDLINVTSSLVIGNSSTSNGGNSVLVGNFSQVTGDTSVGIGNGFRLTIPSSIMMGTGDVVTPNPLAFFNATNSYLDTSRLSIGRTTVVGSNLTTNGDFTGSATGWTLGTGWAYGTNTVVRTANATLGTLTQALTGLVVGNTYILAYKITAGTSATEQDFITPSLTGAFTRTFNNRRFTSVSEFREEFIATATSCTVTFTPTANWAGTIDYVYVKQVTGGNLSVAGITYANTALSVGGATSTNLVDIAGGTTTKAALHFENAVALKTTPVAGDMEYSGGHFYLTNGARHSITTSTGIKITDTTVANTTTETVIYSYTFAAGELHADEHIFSRISGIVSSKSGSSDYTLRVKLGGTTLHTITRTGANVTNVGWRIIFDGTVRTDGASGTFIDNIEWIEDAQTKIFGDTATHAVNTTISRVFEITIQWATADALNTITCNQGFLNFNH